MHKEKRWNKPTYSFGDMIPDELKEMTVPTRQDKNRTGRSGRILSHANRAGWKIGRDGLWESHPMPTRQDEKSDGTVWENPIPCQHGRMTNGNRVGLETRLIDRNDRGCGFPVRQTGVCTHQLLPLKGWWHEIFRREKFLLQRHLYGSSRLFGRITSVMNL